MFVWVKLRHLKSTLRLLITLVLFVSRQTTTRDFVKYFNGCRAKLVESFSSAGITCVGITSDIWSSNAKEDNLSVVGLLLTTLILIGN